VCVCVCVHTHIYGRRDRITGSCSLLAFALILLPRYLTATNFTPGPTGAKSILMGTHTGADRGTHLEIQTDVAGEKARGSQERQA
jgi:hypothetical protein